MSSKKTYKILIPPVMETIVPGKADPLTPPQTELRYDEVKLSDEDAERLAASGTIDINSGRTTTSKQTSESASSTASTSTQTTENTSSSQEEKTAEEVSIDLSKNAAEVIPQIQQVRDRDTLELLLMEETEGENRKGVKNAINAQIESLK